MENRKSPYLVRTSIKADAQNVDARLWLYKFIKDDATKNVNENVLSELKSILDKFESDEPKYGILWTRIAKNVSNFNRPRRELFIEATNSLQQ